MTATKLNLGAEEAAMLRRLFADLEPGDVFLDIGAEHGNWAVPAALAGATVYGFETQSLAAAKATVAAAGVGDRVHLAWATVLDRADGPGVPGCPAPATTVDGFVRDAGLARVDFIKIDIEGSEVRALAGAADTIAKFRPALMVEVHYDGGWNGVPVSVADVTARLPGYRFEVTDYLTTHGWGGAHVLAWPEEPV